MLNNKAPAYVTVTFAVWFRIGVIPSGTGSLFIVYTSRNRMQVENDPESANKVLKNEKYIPMLIMFNKNVKLFSIHIPSIVYIYVCMCGTYLENKVQ